MFWVGHVGRVEVLRPQIILRDLIITEPRAVISRLIHNQTELYGQVTAQVILVQSKAAKVYLFTRASEMLPLGGPSFCLAGWFAVMLDELTLVVHQHAKTGFIYDLEQFCL